MPCDFDPAKDVPAIRLDAGSWSCPFCGGQTLIVSNGDLPDPVRIELYCGNSDCEVREFAVLAQRAGTHTRRRGDLQALAAVDRGTIDEQRRDGYSLSIDAETGRVQSRAISVGAFPDNADEQRLARRQRNTYVKVEPDLEL